MPYGPAPAKTPLKMGPKNGPKMGQKWAKKRQKWAKNGAQFHQGFFKDFQNGIGLFKKVDLVPLFKEGQKWPKMAKNGQKWAKNRPPKTGAP